MAGNAQAQGQFCTVLQERALPSLQLFRWKCAVYRLAPCCKAEAWFRAVLLSLTVTLPGRHCPADCPGCAAQQVDMRVMDACICLPVNTKKSALSLSVCTVPCLAHTTERCHKLPHFCACPQAHLLQQQQHCAATLHAKRQLGRSQLLAVPFWW